MPAKRRRGSRLRWDFRIYWVYREGCVSFRLKPGSSRARPPMNRRATQPRWLKPAG